MFGSSTAPVHAVCYAVGAEPKLLGEEDIPAIVSRAQRGERKAFGDLVRHFQAPVYRLVSRLITNPAIAAEVCQDAFLRAYQAIAGFDASSPFEPWLLRIARNRAYDYLRRTRVRPVLVDAEADAMECPNSNPEAGVANRRLGSRIEAAMATLKPNYRESLHLRINGGLTFEQIGDITGQSPDAAKARFVRARLKLRKLLSGESLPP